MARTDFPYWRYWTQGGRKRSRGKKEEGGVHFPLPPHSRPCHADRNTVHRADRVLQQAVVSPPLLPAVGVRQRKIAGKIFFPRRKIVHRGERGGGHQSVHAPTACSAPQQGGGRRKVGQNRRRRGRRGGIPELSPSLVRS